MVARILVNSMDQVKGSAMPDAPVVSARSAANTGRMLARLRVGRRLFCPAWSLEPEPH
jgi:hypothetical protein